MATTLAPAVGTQSARAPGRPAGSKNKPKGNPVPSSGTTTQAGSAQTAAQVPRPAAPARYALPELTPTLVVRMFENIPEYKRFKINNLDLLMRGMLHVATRPINGVGPGGLPTTSSPFNNFIAQLVMLAVEKGSKGISVNG